MQALAHELVERGHAVRVVGPRCRRASYERVGARFEQYRLAPEHDASSPQTDIVRDWEARTPLGAFARMRDHLMFGPARQFASEVLDAVERERPSVAVIDYMLTGAAAGARCAGVPAVGLIHNVYPLPASGVPPFGMGLTPARGRLGMVRDRVLGRVALRPFAVGLRTLNGVRRELGLPEVDDLPALLDDFELVLVAVPAAFDLAAKASLPPSVRFTGHMTPPAPAQTWENPWDEADSRPLVVVSLSTTFMEQRPLAGRILEAVAPLPIRVLFTLGPALRLDGLPVPENVATAGFVPHGAVMPHAAAAVTHAGLGTVGAALSAGVPLVCVPSGRDQADNAVRVVEAGAGVRLSSRATARAIRAAIERVLADPELQRGREEDAAGVRPGRRDAGRRPRRGHRHRLTLACGKARASGDLVCGRDGGVELAEGGDERRVHVLRSDVASAELEIRGGARVGNERHLEAQVGAGSRRGVDAHARHHPRHHDLVDVEATEVLLEVGAQERVGRALGDERLAVLRYDRRHDLGTVGSFLEEPRACRAEVLDVDDGSPAARNASRTWPALAAAASGSCSGMFPPGK